MKQVICIDADQYPHLVELYQIISEALKQKLTKEDFSSVSHATIVKLVTDGDLSLKEMPDDMKILQSNFSHFYNEEMRETIVQRIGKKIAVFVEE